MCGRYTLTLTKDGIRAEIPTIGSFGMPWRPRYNIAPSQIVPAISSEQPDAVTDLRWGLIPSWAKDPAIAQRLINARAESLTEKPSFREAYRKRRCLILADGFYEWHTEGRKKIPIYFRLKSKKLFTFAGLWETWTPSGGEKIRTCTIVTTEANPLVRRFHARMPVIVPADARSSWLDIARSSAKELEKIVMPYEAVEMEAFPVSSVVNQPLNDAPDCIAPIET